MPQLLHRVQNIWILLLSCFAKTLRPWVMNKSFWKWPVWLLSSNQPIILLFVSISIPTWGLQSCTPWNNLSNIFGEWVVWTSWVVHFLKDLTRSQRKIIKLHFEESKAHERAARNRTVRKINFEEKQTSVWCRQKYDKNEFNFIEFKFNSIQMIRVTWSKPETHYFFHVIWGEESPPCIGLEMTDLACSFDFEGREWLALECLNMTFDTECYRFLCRRKYQEFHLLHSSIDSKDSPLFSAWRVSCFCKEKLLRFHFLARSSRV